VSAHLASVGLPQSHEQTALHLNDPSCVLTLSRALLINNDRAFGASMVTGTSINGQAEA
jgi:hypothetical protein